MEAVQRALVYAKMGYKSPDWDHAYLYELIAFKLKRMEDCLGNGVCSDRKKTSKRIKIARICLERLIEDRYWPYKELTFNRDSSQRINDLQKQDLEYFGKIFVKYSQGWWD